MHYRSVLFTPGDRPRMMRTALSTEADALLLDLEDAVAPDGKETAREATRTFLDERGGEHKDGHASGRNDAATATTPAIGVRINALARGGHDDLDALAVLADGSAPEFVVLPKVTARTEVEALAAALRERGLTPAVRATIESPLGLHNAVEIATAPVVRGLGFGGEDYAAEVGATRTRAGGELLYARQKVVAAAGVGTIPAMDTVYTALDDPDGLRQDAETARDFGFEGKTAIHPAQVPIINDAFTPSQETAAAAERVVDEFESIERGVVAVNGRMIDEPLYRRALATLERARVAGRSRSTNETGGE